MSVISFLKNSHMLVVFRMLVAGPYAPSFRFSRIFTCFFLQKRMSVRLLSVFRILFAKTDVGWLTICFSDVDSWSMTVISFLKNLRTLSAFRMLVTGTCKSFLFSRIYVLFFKNGFRFVHCLYFGCCLAKTDVGWLRICFSDVGSWPMYVILSRICA